MEYIYVHIQRRFGCWNLFFMAFCEKVESVREKRLYTLCLATTKLFYNRWLAMTT